MLLKPNSGMATGSEEALKIFLSSILKGFLLCKFTHLLLYGYFWLLYAYYSVFILVLDCYSFLIFILEVRERECV